MNVQGWQGKNFVSAQDFRSRHPVRKARVEFPGLFLDALHPDTFNEGLYLALFRRNFAFAVDPTGMFGGQANNLFFCPGPNHKITICPEIPTT